jgi:polygalacturonase
VLTKWLLSFFALSSLFILNEGSLAASSVFDPIDFGAKADGQTLDTLPIQKAIDACSARGGGQVVIPAGKTFLTGSLTLRGNIDFHLAPGSVLKGSNDWRNFLPAGALLFAKNAANLTISGQGTIDGNDIAVWQKIADEEAGGNLNDPKWFPEAFAGAYWPFGKKPGEPDKRPGRPMMVIFVGCNHLHMQGITIRSAPSWTVHLVGCQDVAVTEIAIRNSWDIPNDDGIDIDHCQNARIANCFIDSGDDCIVIKNTPNFESYGDCRHITVTGCTVASRSSGLKVDEIYTGAARDIVFDACTVSHSNRGLCIQSRDAGNIENVIFSNIVVETKYTTQKWWGAAEPIHISAFPRTAETKLGYVRNIQFNNLICRGENGCVFQGWESNPMENVTISNMNLELTPAPPGAGGFYDLRPAGIFKGVFERNLPALSIHHARNFTLRNSRITWSTPGDHRYGPPVEQENVIGSIFEDDAIEPSNPGR